MSSSKKNSNSSSSNRNNNNNNSYIEFMPYWNKEEKCYQDTRTGTSISTTHKTKGGGQKTVTQQNVSWPRIKPVEQRVYEEFMTKITSPITGEFYAERDTNGNQVNQPNGGSNAKYVANMIVRLKRFDGSEVLYTQGQIQAFNSFGSQVTKSIEQPETWTKTLFFNERKYQEKSQTVIEICKGPKGLSTVYELPFTAENVDKLYYGYGAGVNGNQLIRRNNNNPNGSVNFYVKDERTGTAVNVEWSNPNTTFNLFKTKDFYYLYNGDYIPLNVRAEMREKAIHSAKSGGLPVVDKPRLEDPNSSKNNYTVDDKGEVDKYHDESKDSYVG